MNNRVREQNSNAPMSAAPMVYDKSGKIAWDQIWNAYCSLAKEGGPSHRDEKHALKKKTRNFKNNAYFRKVMDETVRGVKMIVNYPIGTDKNGWLTLRLQSKNIAKWFSDVINEENVEAKYEGSLLYLPINDDFDILHDVKSIITVIGKAHHYWSTHRTFFSKVIIHLFGFDPQWVQI